MANPPALNEVKLIPVEQLRLDDENPRLAPLVEGSRPTQEELVQFLWDEMAVSELVLSIAANGYFPEEPLFVIPDKKKDSYIVLEGNRRLAAVKILLDDSLRKKLKANSMPQLTPQQKQDLSKLPVYVYGDRKSLWTFLSFRHINSPQEWDPYSKAMYIVKVHDEYRIDLDEIASRIGDQHETVIRLYRGYKVLNQAQEEGIYDIKERYGKKIFFSHWYTALANSKFQDFLGIKVSDFSKSKPVKKAKFGELEELLTWIFGRRSLGKSVEPIIKSQNPDLNRLREVISNPQSLSALRAGSNLDRSFEISEGDNQRFMEAITVAKEQLVMANGLAALAYEGDDEQYSTLTNILKLTRQLKEQMDAKRNS